MLVTVKEIKKDENGLPKPVWTSPDGRVSIYEIIDQDGNQWSTKSHRIGKGEGQSFDCTTEVKNGKTYLRLAEQAGGWQNAAPSNAPTQQQAVPAAPTQNQIAGSDKLAEAMHDFCEAVLEFKLVIKELRGGDHVPTNIDPKAVAEFFGGSVEDDVTEGEPKNGEPEPTFPASTD